MSLDGAKFLVTLSDLLNLTMQTWIRNEGRTEMGMALQGQLGLLRSRALKPVIVYADPHSTFRSMMYDFPGVEMDVGGAGDYVPKVDAKIRRIKELYRTVRSGLAWRLPGSLVPDLVAYAVARLNIHRTSALTEAVAPKVAFTGIPVHYHKDVRLAFGDYVEAYEGTTNTSRPRSSACIALYPANNAAGSWQLFKIDTRTRVRRSNMVKLVTGELIIKAMIQLLMRRNNQPWNRADSAWKRLQKNSNQPACKKSTSKKQMKNKRVFDKERWKKLSKVTTLKRWQKRKQRK
jgi:hypothetical protein